MAKENILMPKLGESVTEGTIEKWLVKKGDYVNKYDPLAEVNTDKVNAEIPSSFSGTILELIAKEGEVLGVGEVVCVIDTSLENKKGSSREETTSTGNKMTDPITLGEVENSTSDGNNKSTFAKGRFSPAVLRLSQEHNIDLSLVEGSGRGGRITRKDVVTLIENKDTLPEEQSAPENTDQAALVASNRQLYTNASSISDDDIVIPVTGVRRAIANSMIKSKQEIPHAWLTVEVDVTNLVNFRNAIKKEFVEQEGFNLTYFAFFVKAVAHALKEFPMMNAMWIDDQIIQKKDVNISIAVASEDELFVPVIKNADEKTIKRIGQDITKLAMKSRAGKLTVDDMQGGTFTVNNTGSFGSIHSAGIIKHPQVAILQVESIVKRPMVIDGMIGIRDMVNLCLSLDHRALDGLICGRFLARVKEILENVSFKNTSVY